MNTSGTQGLGPWMPTKNALADYKQAEIHTA
jgi:hypothetical protein